MNCKALNKPPMQTRDFLTADGFPRLLSAARRGVAMAALTLVAQAVGAQTPAFLQQPMNGQAAAQAGMGGMALQGAGASSGDAGNLAFPARPTLSSGNPVPVDPRQFGGRPGAPGNEGQQGLTPGQTQGATANPALPPLETSEFQIFIQQSTGKLLPRFGANLFTGSPSTFAPVESIAMPPDYRVGPGDEIRIRVWGQLDGESRGMVDRNGNIDIPKIGTVPVAGVRMDALESHIRAAIGRNYRNFELNVTLGQLRSVRIFVVGHARRPGSYTVSALSTLVSALFASGGPSATGSMRQVQLKRGGKVVTEFDVYDFLAKGDQSKDAQLLSGDVIFIPPEGPQVALSGSVRVPGIYELKGAGSLKEVIDLAGGLTATARGQKAMLERIDNRRGRQVEEFDLTEAGLARPVKDGDLVSVLAISPKFDNAITLRGNVAMPLRYPFKTGMRIADLIPEREALIVPDYYLRRNLATRIEAPIDAQRTGLDAQRSAVEVKNANQLMVEMQRGATEINWDYAVIERLNPEDLSTALIPFDLGRAVLQRDATHNLTLQAGDVVTVFSKADFGVPLAKRPVTVVLEDEFKVPGLYRAEPGETLRQLVARAGGLGPNAYLFGAVFTRESTRINQQKTLDETLSRMEADLQRASVTKSQNAVTTDAATLAQETAAQQASIARLRQLKATGRIVLNLPENPTLADIPDLALENGDRLQIPARPATVNVLGSVYSTGAFVHTSGRRLSDYLQAAGGPVRTADAGATYVIRANGSLVSRRQTGWLFGGFDNLALAPGDSVVVPEDFEHTTWTKTLRDYSQILFQFGLGAAAIKVLKN